MIKTVRLPPYQLRPPQARDADPRIRALAYQPGRALLPKLRLDGAGFHPAPGPGKRGFLKIRIPIITAYPVHQPAACARHRAASF